MKIVIVTGMSGAGKTTVLKIFEDIGFHCVDNLPPSFIEDFIKLCIDTGIDQVALGIDIRGGKLFDDLAKSLEKIENYTILYLDSSKDVLLNRYKETRHMHPLAKNDIISVGIDKETVLLEEIKTRADIIIDTSLILPRQLKEKILDLFAENGGKIRLTMNIMSFGFKYGIPKESDLVFDVRFLPNPFYNEELKPLSGLDKPVADYVMNHDVSQRFLQSLLNMLNFLVPHYISEGKSQLITAIGCTGGRHRSVAIARELSEALISQKHPTTVYHRDFNRDPHRLLL